jgi:hypothetical protein
MTFERLDSPDHVIGIRLTGKVTGEDIAQYQQILDEKLKQEQPISLCVDFTGLEDMNFDAFTAGAKADFELLSHLGRFHRCAFVSDKEWPEAVVRYVDPIFPILELKVFPAEERDAAIAWAAEPKAEPEPEKPAVRFLPTDRENVLGFEVDGRFHSAEMSRVVEEFQSWLDRHEKVRLLCRMKRFGGVDPSVFLQSGLIPMKLSAIRKVERYAIVGASPWMKTMIETLGPLFSEMEIRNFPLEEEAEAWAWIEAAPSEDPVPQPA